jgi:hypothetical protein
MGDIFAIFIPAVLITLCMKMYYKKEITDKEALLSLAVNFAISLVFLGIITASQYIKMADSQILSGVVSSKKRQEVSCEHSYSCRCRQSCSGSGKNRSCSQVCDTCYDHSYDVDWNVYTSLSNFTISREDRRGLTEPSRWSSVVVGEYVAERFSYQNPLLADEKTLFVELPETMKDKQFPAYPSVYDYWKINRVIGIPAPLGAEISVYLNETLKQIGARKQLNIVVVGMYNTTPDHFNGLMASWRGGKKNDVILVYGLSPDNTIQWFKSNSYAMGMGNKELHYRLAANATTKPLTMDHIKEQVSLIEKHFVRLSTEELKFKALAIDTPLWAIVLLTFINAIASILLGAYMKQTDLFTTRHRRW